MPKPPIFELKVAKYVTQYQNVNKVSRVEENRQIQVKIVIKVKKVAEIAKMACKIEKEQYMKVPKPPIFELKVAK